MRSPEVQVFSITPDPGTGLIYTAKQRTEFLTRPRHMHPRTAGVKGLPANGRVAVTAPGYLPTHMA
jgi:hypothetical protein